MISHVYAQRGTPQAGEFFKCYRVAPHGIDIGATGKQLPRDLPTNAAGGARNKHALAAEIKMCAVQSQASCNRCMIGFSAGYSAT